MEQVPVTKRTIALKMELNHKGIPVAKLAEELGVQSVDEDALLKGVVAFENYADVLLSFGQEGIFWAPVKSKEVTDSLEMRGLKEELETLRLRVEEKEKLKMPFTPLSHENVVDFY